MSMRTSVLRTTLTLAALVVVGCGVNVSVETLPNPAALGQPVEVKVTVGNPSECPLTDVFAQVAVISENFDLEVTAGATTSGLPASDDLESLCTILHDPTATLCELIAEEDDGFPQSLVEQCCEDGDFAEQNPLTCESGEATTPTDSELRDLIIARARALGLPVDGIPTVGSLAATSGPSSGCMLVFEEPGFAVFACELGDIPAGESVMASGFFTPTIAGRYFSFVFADGDSECLDEVFPGGTDCSVSSVVVSSAAPAASSIGLIMVILGMFAIGGYAIRLRRPEA